MRRAKGFTAVELMVVIAIVAILAALALPSFANMIRRYQTKQDQNALIDTLYFARSEAVKRGGGVRVAKLPGMPNCPTAADWDCGWQVYLDPIPSGVPGIPADGVLKRVETKEKNFIQATMAGGVLILGRWGNPSAGFGVNVQNKQDGMIGQCVNLSSGGRVNLADNCSP